MYTVERQSTAGKPAQLNFLNVSACLVFLFLAVGAATAKTAAGVHFPLTVQLDALHVDLKVSIFRECR